MMDLGPPPRAIAAVDRAWAQPRAALLVSTAVPDPGGTGVERRAWQHLWCLSNLFDLDLVIQPRRRRGTIPQAVTERCSSVTLLPLVESSYFNVVPRGSTGFTLANELLRLGRRIWHPYLPATRRAALSTLSARPDATYCAALLFRLDTAWLAPWARARLAPGGRMVMDLDDLDSAFMRQQAAMGRADRGLELTLAYQTRAASLARIERQVGRKFDWITLSSPLEVAHMRRKAGRGATLTALPNCFDLRGTPLAPRANRDGKLRLLFVGFLGYVANSDAVSWFVREVLPLIEAEAGPVVELTVVGRDAPAELAALHDPPRINLTGWLPDLEQAYATTDLAIMPIRMGSGTRIKALEAASMGRATVSTALGVAGLGFEPNRHYALGGSPAAFAQACLHLHRHPDQAAALVQRARAHVRQDFSFASAVERLRALVEAEGRPS